jgi:hypothetical protein
MRERKQQWNARNVEKQRERERETERDRCIPELNLNEPTS